MRMHLMAGIVVSTAMVVAQPRTPIDVARLGPQVGEQVPDFTLRDQDGTTRSLQSVMGERGAMLVFIRSADW
jgi:peroxiredoxin